MTAEQVKEKIKDILHPDQRTHHRVTTPDAAAGFPTLVPNATKTRNIPESASNPGSRPDVSSETDSTPPYGAALGQNQAPPPVPLDEAAMLGIAPVPTPPGNLPGKSPLGIPEKQEPAAAPPSDDTGLDVIGEEPNSDSKVLPIIPVSDVETKDRPVIESDVKTKNYPGPQPDLQEKNLPGTEPEEEHAATALQTADMTSEGAPAHSHLED